MDNCGFDTLYLPLRHIFTSPRGIGFYPFDTIYTC